MAEKAITQNQKILKYLKTHKYKGITSVDVSDFQQESMISKSRVTTSTRLWNTLRPKKEHARVMQDIFCTHKGQIWSD